VVLKRLLRDLRDYPTTTMRHVDYDRYWRERDKGKFRQRYAMVAEWVEPGSKVLDIGCGDGMLLAYLRDQRAVDPLGMDISSEAVAFVRSMGIQAFQTDVLDAGFQLPDEYDYIVLSEVLEHLSEPETLMLKLQHHARRGVIVSIPNTGFYKYRLRLLCGAFPVQWVYYPGEHLRFWTVGDFIWWSAQLGYTVKAIRSSNGLHPLDQRWPGLWSKQTLFWLIERQ
jgi:methionine biosynthesis protein MetW